MPNLSGFYLENNTHFNTHFPASTHRQNADVKIKATENKDFACLFTAVFSCPKDGETFDPLRLHHTAESSKVPWLRALLDFSFALREVL
nr:MAG TPA: hypothetical protein [Caudoviricetes sp.]